MWPFFLSTFLINFCMYTFFLIVKVAGNYLFTFMWLLVMVPANAVYVVLGPLAMTLFVLMDDNVDHQERWKSAGDWIHNEFWHKYLDIACEEDKRNYIIFSGTIAVVTISVTVNYVF